MTNVVNLPVITRLDLDPERVLQAALDEGMTGVVVIGFDADGDEYFASSYANGADVLWLMKRCEKRLLDVVDEY